MKKALARDAMAALVLFLLVIVIGLGLIDKGHPWGDDFAAYMLEARAIANGTMDEQSRINRMIHPAEISFGEEEMPEKLTYVWGYPLILSMIYRVIGYELGEIGMPIAYKLPNLIAFAIFVAIIFLFYRRRFSFIPSLFLALLFALHRDMLLYVNEMLSDVFCLLLSMMALLFAEIFFDCGTGKKKACIGALLGAALWYNYEVRLNGVTVIYIVLFAHVLHLLRARPAKREWTVQLVPYAVLLALLGISLCVMPQATSNTAHIASGPNSLFAYNLYYYKGLIRDWIRQMVPAYGPLRDYIHYIVYGMIVVGVLCAGLARNLHLTALMFGTFAVVLLLPYAQPIRYLFNALPLMLLFAGYGAQFIWKWIKRCTSTRCRMLVRYTGYAAMLLCVLSMSTDVAKDIREHKRLGGMNYRYGAYTDDALDIYQYIRENIDDESLIACIKARALTLNTGKNFYRPGVNGNRYKDMNYLLSIKNIEDDGEYDIVTQAIWPEMWEEMTEVYRNDTFVLYELSESYRLAEDTP